MHDFPTVEHMARLAFLGMSARATAAAEWDQNDEVKRLVITVTRDGEFAPVVELEYFGDHPIPLAGLSL